MVRKCALARGSLRNLLSIRRRLSRICLMASGWNSNSSRPATMKARMRLTGSFSNTSGEVMLSRPVSTMKAVSPLILVLPDRKGASTRPTRSMSLA
ncbi:hypothetical protein D3C86_1779660 [compost metagenome]